MLNQHKRLRTFYEDVHRPECICGQVRRPFHQPRFLLHFWNEVVWCHRLLTTVWIYIPKYWYGIFRKWIYAFGVVFPPLQNFHPIPSPLCTSISNKSTCRSFELRNSFSCLFQKCRGAKHFSQQSRRTSWSFGPITQLSMIIFTPGKEVPKTCDLGFCWGETLPKFGAKPG